jgi:glutamyl-tRNA reductase
MNLRMVGCTHRASGVDLRQQLAFGTEQTSDALARWRERFPTAEFALLSTCNRVELYAAGAGPVEAKSYRSTSATRSPTFTPSRRASTAWWSASRRFSPR